AETAIGRGDDPLAADQIGKAQYALDDLPRPCRRRNTPAPGRRSCWRTAAPRSMACLGAAEQGKAGRRTSPRSRCERKARLETRALGVRSPLELRYTFYDFAWVARSLR